MPVIIFTTKSIISFGQIYVSTRNTIIITLANIKQPYTKEKWIEREQRIPSKQEICICKLCSDYSDHIHKRQRCILVRMQEMISGESDKNVFNNEIKTFLSEPFGDDFAKNFAIQSKRISQHLFSQHHWKWKMLSTTCDPLMQQKLW